MKPTFRSSEMDRVLTCNGSITLTRLVAPREGDEGFEGVLLHHLIASRLIAEFGAIPPDGGLPPPQVPAGYKLPAFSAWIVDWAIRHVRDTIPADWSLMVEVPLAYEYQWREPKMLTVVEWIDGQPVVTTKEVDGWTNSGHIDVLGISPDGLRSHGIDWKTGRDPVDPAECNEQVNSYICLQKRAWESLTGCTFQIAQPRADEDAGFERVSTVELAGDRLERACAVLDQRVSAAMDNAMEVNSGRKQCRWCPAKLQCEAALADREFMKATLTKESLARVKKKPDDAVIGDWVITMRTLKAAAEEAENMLHERLDASGCVQAGCGTTITRKIQRGSYTVERPQEFMQAFRSILPSEGSLAKCFEPSMTRCKDEIAEVLGVNKTGGAPVTAETIFDAHLRPHTSQGERRVLVFT